MPSASIMIRRTEVRPFTDKQIKLARNLRRPSRDRHRERAAVQGTRRTQHGVARGAGAADGDERDFAGHRQLADGYPAGAATWWPRMPRGCAIQAMRRFIASRATWHARWPLTVRRRQFLRSESLGQSAAGRRAGERYSIGNRSLFNIPRSRSWNGPSLDCQFGSPRNSYRVGGSVAARRDCHRCDRNSPHGVAAIHRRTDRAAQNLRRSGGDRHRERAAVPRAHRVAGAADGDERDSWCHRQLADGYSAGAGCSGGKRRATV